MLTIPLLWVSRESTGFLYTSSDKISVCQTLKHRVRENYYFLKSNSMSCVHKNVINQTLNDYPNNFKYPDSIPTYRTYPDRKRSFCRQPLCLPSVWWLSSSALLLSLSIPLLIGGSSFRLPNWTKDQWLSRNPSVLQNQTAERATLSDWVAVGSLSSIRQLFWNTQTIFCKPI